MRFPKPHLYFQTFSDKPRGTSKVQYDKENILFSFKSWNACPRRVLCRMATCHTISGADSSLLLVVVVGGVFFSFELKSA